MEAQKPGTLGRWAKRLTVGIISSALMLTTASFATADSPAPPSSGTEVAAPGKITVSAARKAYLGDVTFVTGSLSGFSGPVELRLQVKRGDDWTTVTTVTTSAPTFERRLKYQEGTKGTLSWRILASSVDNGTSVSSTVKQTRVSDPTISVTTAHKTRTVGYDVVLTGKLKGFIDDKVTVYSQVKVNGNWKTLTKKTGSGATYAVKANYKTGSTGAYTFRAVVKQGSQRVVSQSLKVTRIPKKSVSINKNKVATVGHDVSLSGTIKGYSGKVKVYAQAKVNGKWSTKATRTVSAKYSGTKYSVPVTYKHSTTGAISWRLVAKKDSDRTVSKTTKVTRTLKGIDKRCVSGRVLCISKSDRKLRWMIDGKVVTTLDTRFGASSTPTRNGSFTVFRKSRDHVSSLYGSSMPFAMFFSGGQAVHYSSDFARRGYVGASHGCVNIRDYNGIKKLFDKVRIGDKVVVY